MKKSIVWLIITVFIFAGCTQVNENKYLAQGNNYVRSSNYSLALEQFKLAINDDPLLTDAYLNAADILIPKGKYEEAKEILVQGSEYAFVKTPILAKLGELELLQLNYDAALDYFNQALVKDGQYQPAIYGKIKVLALKGENEALVDYAVSLNPSILSQEMQIIKGLVLISDAFAAQDSFNQAQNGSNPDLAAKAESLNKLMQDLEQKDDKLYSLAQIAFEALSYKWYASVLPVTDLMIAENEYYEGGYIYRGTIYLNQGDFSKAEVDLEKAIAFNPNLTDTRILLAQARFALGKNEDGVKLLTLAKEPISSIEEQKFTDIVNILVNAQEFSHIKEFLDAYTKGGSLLNPELQVIKLNTLVELELVTEAKTFAESLLQTKENFSAAELADIYADFGYVLFQLAEKSKGLELIQQAKATDPTLAKSYFYEGLIYLDQADTKATKTAFEKAIDLDFSEKITIKAESYLSEL